MALSEAVGFGAGQVVIFEGVSGVRHIYVHLPFCAHRCGYALEQPARRLGGRPAAPDGDPDRLRALGVGAGDAVRERSGHAAGLRLRRLRPSATTR